MNEDAEEEMARTKLQSCSILEGKKEKKSVQRLGREHAVCREEARCV